MEPFNYNRPKEPQYAAYKNDPGWQRIYRFLQGGFWHSTKAECWDAIREAGAVKPNIGAQFGANWPQSETSYAFNHKCVGLFDFATPTQEEVIEVWLLHVMYQFKHSDVLLQLDRARLQPRIIPNEVAYPPPDGKGRESGCIPYCEVFYPGDIAIEAISQVYKLEGSREDFKPVAVAG